MDRAAVVSEFIEPDKASRGWPGLWAACTALAIGGILSLSAWSQSGPASTGFVAALGCITSVAYLSTAYLLSNRLVISRSPALILLASTYLLCGLAVGAQTMTFPGVDPIWGKYGPEATHWFWVVWHAAGAIGIIGFVALDDEWTNRHAREMPNFCPSDVAARISLGDAGAFMRGPLLLAVTSIAGAAVLLWRDPMPFAAWFGTWLLPPAVVALLLVLDVAAIVLLAFALRRDNLIRTWLLLAAIASMFDVAAMSWSVGPFTVGWYFSQACALVAATVLPLVLLADLRKRLGAVDDRPPLDPALVDSRTGLANERGLIVQLGRMAQLAIRKSAPLSIAVATVTDPDAAVLVLRRLFRASDVIGRTGEREFAVILTPGSEASLRWLRRRLDAETRNGILRDRIGLRIGLGMFDPSEPRAFGELLSEAMNAAREQLRDIAVG